MMQAVRRINPLEDLKALPQVPCARSSLLFGMISAAGIGTIQIFSGRGMFNESCGSTFTSTLGIRAATNWTMATFLIVTVFGWYVNDEAQRMGPLTSLGRRAVARMQRNRPR